MEGDGGFGCRSIFVGERLSHGKAKGVSGRGRLGGSDQVQEALLRLREVVRPQDGRAPH